MKILNLDKKHYIQFRDDGVKCSLVFKCKYDDIWIGKPTFENFEEAHKYYMERILAPYKSIIKELSYISFVKTKIDNNLQRIKELIQEEH